MVVAFSLGESLIEELLQRGADVNAKSNFGSTALMHAVNFHKKAVERVRVLLRYGADVNLTDSKGRNAMSYIEHRLEIAEMAEVAKILRKASTDK